jgi:hypothetical protein
LLSHSNTFINLLFLFGSLTSFNDRSISSSIRFNRNLLSDFKHGADFTSVPPVRDSMKQCSSRAPPGGLGSAPAPPKLSDIPPLSQHFSLPSPL